MTDIVKKIITANSVKNNASITYTTPVGRYQVKQRAINDTTPISGVNGVTDNGYLDRRFDDNSYYTS